MGQRQTELSDLAGFGGRGGGWGWVATTVFASRARAFFIELWFLFGLGNDVRCLHGGESGECIATMMTRQSVLP